MAPARSNRRTHQEQPVQLRNTPSDTNAANKTDLFLEPMMGTPLTVYIEKDVEEKESLVELIAVRTFTLSILDFLTSPQKHGGAVSPGYSGTPYILGKKGKVVLHYRWIHECIRVGALQTFQNNWAGCKVTGTEKLNLSTSPPSQDGPACSTQSTQVPPMQSVPSHPQTVPSIVSPDPLVHPPQQGSYAYSVYGHAIPPLSRGIQPPTAAPPQSWQAPNAIAPQHTHIPPQPPGMLSRPAHPYRDGPWVSGFDQPPQIPEWVPPPGEFPYDPAEYQQSYEQQTYMPEAGPSTASSSCAHVETATAEKPRGRKRVRSQATPAAPPSTLVLNRKNPPARSPSPPTRVIKSTYGGNLFTSDDVLYLKKYIDYCQEQGLVLRFYSWRRYCNKHQIRLGGYSMDTGDLGTPPADVDQDPGGTNEAKGGMTGPGVIAAAQQRLQREENRSRDRSPTPPRALFRSTTGKGVAFTDDDVVFLVRLMEYRKSQDRFDMVAFWKDVASKAPHHSRASWMKFWRRHKHELNRAEEDDPLPQPPEKKMRYSRSDDVLLAKYFFTKPEGTSDKVFQAFGRLVTPITLGRGGRSIIEFTKRRSIILFKDSLVERILMSMRVQARRSPKCLRIVKWLRHSEAVQDQVDLFYRDGYIKVPGFLSKEQVNSLLARSKQLLDQFDPENHPLTKFTTSDHNHVGDEYFLESGDKIRYFLEEDAVGSNGRLTRDKAKAVNKIGHGLHILDPVFRKVTLENEKLKSVVKDLRFHHDPVALQSMVIFKQPEIGGAGLVDL
ncbi:hypothetical protein EV401DRAFT_1885878 [Pisolithus croceorrhizus]|nr:hypothetical protein EV401DRAFT_1885878 [Pisolithus croceorrhizus]